MRQNAILTNEKSIGTYVFNKTFCKDVNGKRNNHKVKVDSEIIRMKNTIPVINEKVSVRMILELNSKEQMQGLTLSM